METPGPDVKLRVHDVHDRRQRRAGPTKRFPFRRTGSLSVRARLCLEFTLSQRSPVRLRRRRVLRAYTSARGRSGHLPAVYTYVRRRVAASNSGIKALTRPPGLHFSPTRSRRTQLPNTAAPLAPATSASARLRPPAKMPPPKGALLTPRRAILLGAGAGALVLLTMKTDAYPLADPLRTRETSGTQRVAKRYEAAGDAPAAGNRDGVPARNVKSGSKYWTGVWRRKGRGGWRGRLRGDRR
ncbi:hypothetical protein BDY21DRAFT_351911 [Lineolata rhizophorae]|uniref:Uncharacterized protein n=1 Tax=Lineolata rhizophorae TaxID=578093 RepID=A0A6A6NT18_9PEZI|nr:hypothetical protein BDY21DRAFT_351911 [Lineolata rhizophorae]